MMPPWNVALKNMFRFRAVKCGISEKDCNILGLFMLKTPQDLSCFWMQKERVGRGEYLCTIGKGSGLVHDGRVWARGAIV